MTADAVGGVWTYALDLAEGLSRRGVSTSLAVLGPAPDAVQRAAAAAIPGLSLLETGLPLDWTAERAVEVEAAGIRFAMLAAELRPDVVHLNHPALAAVARFPTPVVAVAHSCVKTWWRAVEGDAPLTDDLAWRAELTGRGYVAADLVLAPTAAFARATAEAYGLPEPQVVNNGRRTPPEAPTGGPADHAFSAGRLWDRGKGAATLNAAAALGGFALVAAGPTVAPHGEAADLPHLRLLGSLSAEQVEAHLVQRPVFVSAAVYEPFGLAVLEAAQAGCALVLSDIPTFRELWDGAAVFVPPGDAQGFAAALRAVLADGARREALAAAARRRADAFGVQAMVEGVLAAYAALPRRTPAEAAA